MFALEHRTYKHSPPRLQQTFRKLARYMENTNTHAMIAGRKSSYTVADASESGKYKMFIGGWATGESEAGSQGTEAGPGSAGIMSVNAEDGDLDV